MPLDWSQIVERYKHGADLPSMPGARTLKVVGADEQYIYVSHRLWQDKLSRAYLEKAMRLLEDGQMTRNYGDVIDHYRTFIADERPTTAATVLKDLGFLD